MRTHSNMRFALILLIVAGGAVPAPAQAPKTDPTRPRACWLKEPYALVRPPLVKGHTRFRLVRGRLATPEELSRWQNPVHVNGIVETEELVTDIDTIAVTPRYAIAHTRQYLFWLIDLDAPEMIPLRCDSLREVNALLADRRERAIDATGFQDFAEVVARRKPPYDPPPIDDLYLPLFFFVLLLLVAGVMIWYSIRLRRKIDRQVADQQALEATPPDTPIAYLARELPPEDTGPSEAYRPK